MRYTDFQKSALRHLESCYHLLENVDNSTAPNKKIKTDRLLMNVYYLSGYVLECSIKFAFFKAIKFSKDSSISTFEYTDGTYQYGFTKNHERNLKEHNLVSLKTYLESVDKNLPHNIPFISVSIRNSRYDAMVKRWNSEIRYSLAEYARLEEAIEHNLVKQYLDDIVKPIYEVLTKR